MKLIRELREEIENLRLMLSKVSPVSELCCRGCSSCLLSRESVAVLCVLSVLNLSLCFIGA